MWFVVQYIQYHTSGLYLFCSLNGDINFEITYDSIISPKMDVPLFCRPHIWADSWLDDGSVFTLPVCRSTPLEYHVPKVMTDWPILKPWAAD